MSNGIGLLREVMALTSNVSDLKEQVIRLEERVFSNTERIVKLESREEALLEKAKNAFLTSAVEVNARLIERITKLERASTQIPPDKQLES